MLFVAAGNVKAQEPIKAKMGKGIVFMAKDSTLKCKFEMRFQTLFTGEFDLDAASNPFEGEAMIRRARLKFSGFVFNDRLDYKMEIGLSNRDIQVRGRSSDYTNVILDAWMRYRIAKNLRFRVGQWKIPGNRERVISSGNLQFVDRSHVNSRFNIDRDMGMMLENKFEFGNMIWIQQGALTLGEGRNRMTPGDGFCYTGRMEFLPLGAFSKKGDYIEGSLFREPKPKISIGATYSFNDQAQRSRGQLGGFLYDERDLYVAHIDYIFKWGGFSSQGEFGYRHAANPVTTDGEDIEYVYVGQGLNGQVAYMLKNNNEFGFRFTSVTPHEDIQHLTDRRNETTIAWSKYLVGHNLKIQADATYLQLLPLVSTRTQSSTIVLRVTTNLNF